MLTPRGIGALVLATAAFLTGPLASFADEVAPAAPQAPFFKAEDVFGGQRPALNDPFGLIWANNPWQPLAPAFGAFNFAPAGADPGYVANTAPPSLAQALQNQYQQQYQQQAMMQTYSNWLAGRNARSSGPSRWLPGMGSTSTGDPCSPGAHLSFAYAQMFLPNGVSGSGGGPVAGQCFVAGTPVQLDSQTANAIETIQIGQRVSGSSAAIDMSIDPAGWRRLELRAHKRDGTEANIVLLRPLAWLKQHDVAIGGKAPISGPECGLDGSAEVLAIGPCALIARGDGPVVTGTYRHLANRVLDLFVEGQKEPIGTTPNHLFWSVKRDGLVRADELRRGEHLQGSLSNPRVSGVVERPAGAAVYNLEVQGGSPYRVGAAGIAVSSVISK
jgi:hypothetical protein